MQEKVELQLVTGTFWASSFFVSEKNQRQCDGGSGTGTNIQITMMY
jgi:hypothetical protein